MSPIPINSSLGMAISLAIAFTVTPWLALKLMKPQAVGHSGGVASAFRRRLERFFAALLTPLLSSARKRWLLLAGILAALLLSAGLTVVQWVVLKMLPFDNKSEFQVVVDMPAGPRWRARPPCCTKWAPSWRASPRCATFRATPAPRARSPSTAWCDSTTCALTPSRATCR